MATSDNGAEIIHHKQAADAVGGSRTAPQNYGKYQVITCHNGDFSGKTGRKLDLSKTDVTGNLGHCPHIPDFDKYWRVLAVVRCLSYFLEINSLM